MSLPDEVGTGGGLCSLGGVEVSDSGPSTIIIGGCSTRELSTTAAVSYLWKRISGVTIIRGFHRQMCYYNTCARLSGKLRLAQVY